MSRNTRLNCRSTPRWSFKALLLGIGLGALVSGSAFASVVTVQSNKDFTGSSVSFTLNTDLVTFSDITSTSDPTLLEAVGVMTAGGAGVAFTPITGEPASLGYPTPGNLQTFGPSNKAEFTSFATTTGIPFSIVPFAIGLSDTIGNNTYYGYAIFDSTVLKSYAFETTPNVAVVLPVPLPSSAPMLGAALFVLGAFGYRRHRARIVDAS